MRAMVLEEIGGPLALREVGRPAPDRTEALIRVEACGVCRTDLHLLDGEVPAPLPRILGHQVVGVTEDGRRVGVPWLAKTCGTCRYCTSNRENLCLQALFTGRDVDGGFAEWMVADERFCLPLPAGRPAPQLAPLLCGGLIGYRALRMCGEPVRLGIYGFGSAAHIVCQLATAQGCEVYALTRAGDVAGQEFALSLGAVWAGSSEEPPPVQLDAAIIFAPDGRLVPRALRAIGPGGTVVCGGIHMSEIPALPYEDLWQERALRSVANLTRRDGIEFLALAATVPIRTEVHEYPLEEAQRALDDLRAGAFTGSAVIVPSPTEPDDLRRGYRRSDGQR